MENFEFEVHQIILLLLENQNIVKAFWEEDRKSDSPFYRAIVNKCFSEFPINVNFFCLAASSLIGNETESYCEFEQDFRDMMSSLKTFAVFEDRVQKKGN
jgi:hypothetical protein